MLLSFLFLLLIPKILSGISGIAQKYLKFLHTQNIFPFCILNLKKTPGVGMPGATCRYSPLDGRIISKFKTPPFSFVVVFHSNA